MDPLTDLHRESTRRRVDADGRPHLSGAAVEVSNVG